MNTTLARGWLWILAAAVVGALVTLTLLWQFDRAPARESYHAVLLTSGDLYFGKLHTFPWPSLSDVYFLDRDQSNPQSPYRLTKFSNAFWGPADRLELNSSQILWVAELSPASPVTRAIRSVHLGGVPPVSAPPLTEPSSTSSPSSRPVR